MIIPPSPITIHDYKFYFFLVRLVDGQSASEGRVEVYYSGTWGVVCGAGWDMLNAAVVCRSLGYGGVSSYLVNITFKPENGTIWMSDVRCISNETSLSQCAHSGWGRNSCRESQAAGVMCFEKGNMCFFSNSCKLLNRKSYIRTR